MVLLGNGARAEAAVSEESELAADVLVAGPRKVLGSLHPTAAADLSRFGSKMRLIENVGG